jgi:hypothetical protein
MGCNQVSVVSRIDAIRRHAAFRLKQDIGQVSHTQHIHTYIYSLAHPPTNTTPPPSYEEYRERARLDALPDFTWCLLKGCKAGQIHDPAEPKFRCSSCRRSHCVKHRVKWHKGETCDEYDYRTNGTLKAHEEEMSKWMIEISCKPCPGCKRNIEKSTGCDHMTCEFPPYPLYCCCFG